MAARFSELRDLTVRQRLLFMLRYAREWVKSEEGLKHLAMRRAAKLEAFLKPLRAKVAAERAAEAKLARMAGIRLPRNPTTTQQMVDCWRAANVKRGRLNRMCKAQWLDEFGDRPRKSCGLDDWNRMRRLCLRQWEDEG
jgi:hypothetical protein